MAISGTFGAGSAATSTVVGNGAGFTAGTCNTTKMTNLFPNYPLQITGCILPGGSTGIGGYVDVKYELSQSCTAGTATGNKFFMTMGGVTLGAVLTVPPTNQSYRGNLRIRNIDNSSQLVTVGTSDGTGSTAAAQNLSLDFTIDQALRFYQVAGETGTNCLSLHGWSVEAHKISATATAAPLVAGRNTFWGLNHHFTYGNTPDRPTIISAMNAMKFNTLRVDWYGISHSVGGIDNTTWITDMASAMQVANLNMCLVVGHVGPYSVAGVMQDEPTTYSYFFDQGSYIAALTKPLGVYMYEMGNEKDSVASIRVTVSSQGTSLNDFSFSANTSLPSWNSWRGAMRGIYDGIRSVHPTAKIGSNAFTNSSIWCSDALWDGVGPDGSTGNNVVRWDWTNWHVYAATGLVANVPYSGLTGSQGTFNLFKYLHHAYGKPIVITEYNPSDSGTGSAESKLIVALSSWYALQDSLNIAGVHYYDWFDAPFAIAPSNAAPTVLNSVGSKLVAFISNFPALK